jgi:hypothetical protein
MTTFVLELLNLPVLVQDNVFSCINEKQSTFVSSFSSPSDSTLFWLIRWPAFLAESSVISRSPCSCTFRGWLWPLPLSSPITITLMISLVLWDLLYTVSGSPFSCSDVILFQNYETLRFTVLSSILGSSYILSIRLLTRKKLDQWWKCHLLWPVDRLIHSVVRASLVKQCLLCEGEV